MAFKSDVISTINDNKLLTAMKLSICYSYSNSGSHTSLGTNGKNIAARVVFYGHTKGNKIAFAEAYLNTTDGYIESVPAAAVITGIPVSKWAWISWEIQTPNGCDFACIHGQPQLIWVVQGGTDELDASIRLKASVPSNNSANVTVGDLEGQES